MDDVIDRVNKGGCRSCNEPIDDACDRKDDGKEDRHTLYHFDHRSICFDCLFFPSGVVAVI
jgi:hypothetical protein